MSHAIQNLEKLLRPQSVAIVGASPREGAFSAQLVKAVRSLGYAGDVFLVNPRYEEIDGAPCYPSLAALPGRPDCVLYAVGDQRLAEAVEAAAECGIRGGVIFGRAHGDGPDGRPIQSAVAAIARSSGMAICGANCMGFLNLLDRIQVTGMPFASFGRADGVSLISHSGSTWSGMTGNRRGVGFDFAISAGQELVTGVGDYIDYLLDLPSTRAVACVLETLRDPEAFLRAADRADGKNIPIIVLKLGRSEDGKRFAVSHSGAISGATAAYDAVFRQRNVIQTRTLDELLDTIELFKGDRRPRNSGLVLGTDSGGERQLIVDIAADVGLGFAGLSPSTLTHLEELLDPGMEAANPLDYWGDGQDVMAPCLTAMAEDPAAGMVVMATNMPAGRPFSNQCADAVIAVRQQVAKPVALMGNIATTMDPAGLDRVRAAGVPVLMGTESGLRAIRHFLDYAGRVPRDQHAARRSQAEAGLKKRHFPGQRDGILSSAEGFALLREFGIATAPFARVDGEADLAGFIARHGLPVVLKIDDPAVPHKSEVGGVLVNIGSDEAAREGYGVLKQRHPDAPIIIQKQARGRELILGMTTDPDFGPMITLGLGGIYTEVFKDAVMLPPPVTRDEALNALRSLKSFPLLAGVRGEAPVDLDGLAAAVVAFSHLCVELRGVVSEIEVNPLLAGPDEALAVDCLTVLSREFSHV